MKKITLLILATFLLTSFKADKNQEHITSVQYEMRLDFMQQRCRMLVGMFEKQYKDEEMSAEYAFDYAEMLQTIDGCAEGLKEYKVLFK